MTEHVFLTAGSLTTAFGTLAAAVVCPPAALTSVGSLLVLAAGGLLWLVAWYAAIGAGHRQPLVAALLAWAVVCSQLRCLEGGA